MVEVTIGTTGESCWRRNPVSIFPVAAARKASSGAFVRPGGVVGVPSGHRIVSEVEFRRVWHWGPPDLSAGRAACGAGSVGSAALSFLGYATCPRLCGEERTDRECLPVHCARMAIPFGLLCLPAEYHHRGVHPRLVLCDRSQLRVQGRKPVDGYRDM